MMTRNTLAYILMFLLMLGCSGDDGDPGGNQGANRSLNLLAAGASANDILSNNTYSDIVVEAVYVEGFQPTTEAMNNFETYLRERTFKEDIEFVYRSIPSPNEEDFSIQEVADLEDDNRSLYNEGETLAIYIFFADAPDEDDDRDTGVVTLGSVYRNTSMVIYEETVRFLANQSVLITPADVETATLNHEFGHLFGLVNLGTPTVNDHEDVVRDDNGDPILDGSGNPQGNRHCSIEGCLMRAELQFGQGIMSMLKDRKARGLAVPDLDAECILDLQANGGR